MFLCANRYVLEDLMTISTWQAGARGSFVCVVPQWGCGLRKAYGSDYVVVLILNIVLLSAFVFQIGVFVLIDLQPDTKH